MSREKSQMGILFALVVLIGNGIHPIINNSRPEGFESLIFAWLMSLWEFLGVIPIVLLERKNKKVTAQNSSELINNHPTLDPVRKRAIIGRMLVVGIIFTVATYFYIEGLTLTGSISGSIALKSAPIYAMIIGALFLGEKMTWKQVITIFFMLFGLIYLATAGTFNLDQFGIGFAMLLLVPLLWGSGHAMIKPLLKSGEITTPTAIMVRTGLVSLILFTISVGVNGLEAIKSTLVSPIHMGFAALMGITYLLMHYAWYRSITTIELGLASALVIPSPALTTLFSIIVTNEPIYSYHIIGMAVMFIGLYILIALKPRTNKNEANSESKE